MRVKNKVPFLFHAVLCLVLIVALYSCDDMMDIHEEPGESVNQETGTAEFYVLSEGLFNLNNSSLMRYTFYNGKNIPDYFLRVNRRGLGDTANDMAIYGSKLYIVVNVSSQLEVVDLQTGKSLKRIPIFTENGSSRQPRFITFHKDKAYVCSFDGTVARIDTTSLNIEAYIHAGRNPDGICVQNDKLYVSNSGGLDNPNYDNTVSVIDIASFTEIKKINVGTNPGKIQPDKYGNVYVSVRGNITDNNSQLVKIDSKTDEVVETINQQALNFAISNEFAYLYSYDYNRKTVQIKVYNIKTGRVERENFITDGTTITTPYGINVNPYNGNIYITDAYDYKVKGNVLCFNPQGQLQFKINNVGINPNTIVFSDRLSNSVIDDNPQDPNQPTAYASKVLEYCPAPTQFMNTTTTAYREGFTYDEVLKQATEQIKQRYLLTLGAFGGYIILGFDQSIPNIKGEYDFKVYGNAYFNSNSNGGSAEPGIVLVSKDTNNNGLADDEWYELAGSEYHSDKSIRNYEITYYRPESVLAPVRWTDNQGNEGVIPRNSSHADYSYYPAWVKEDKLIFSGTRLADNGKQENNNWIQYPYEWGYADNRSNNSEYSQFKIDWAVDSNGNPVELDRIDFVKIYTAVNQVCGWLGETSTEISTIENLHFKN